MPGIEKLKRINKTSDSLQYCEKAVEDGLENLVKNNLRRAELTVI